MRNSFTVTTGLRLARSPNARERAARRRLLAAATVAGLTLAGGLLGWATAPRSVGSETPTSPFSYFPSE